MEKRRLFGLHKKRLLERLARVERRQAEARGATRVDGDHRPANRGERAAVTGQGYLALGLAQQADELREHLIALDRVSPELRTRVCVGALVAIETDTAEEQRLLLLPGGDGACLEASSGVTVVSPGAPIVRALLGAREQEEVRVQRGGELVDVVVTGVQ